METKFNSQICTTREQSERLLSLGLKKETEDMMWGTITLNGQPFTFSSAECWDNAQITETHFPAWSLHRLIEMMPVSLPCEIEGMQGLFSLTRRDDESVTVGYTWSLERTGNIYDAMISAIEWLIKNEDFSNEYVA